MHQSDFAQLRNLEDYAQPDNRPNQNSYMKYFVYSKGITLFQGMKGDFENWKLHEGAVYFKRDAGPTIEKYLDQEALNDAKLNWVESEHNRLLQFRHDLQSYYGLRGHEKADMLYDIAVDFSTEQRCNTVDELEDVAARFEKLRNLLK
jgi:hypothetical protein